jgi:hypothetical protein
VNIEACVGGVQADVAIACSKRVPSAAILSIVGVVGRS